MEWRTYIPFDRKWKNSCGKPSLIGFVAQTFFKTNFFQQFHFQRTLSDLHLPNSKNRLSISWNNNLNVKTVSIATSEYFFCPPCFPELFGIHDFIADGDSHKVREPLLRRKDSYSLQFMTRYFRLYFGFWFLLCNSFSCDFSWWENLIR